MKGPIPTRSNQRFGCLSLAFVLSLLSPLLLLLTSNLVKSTADATTSVKLASEHLLFKNNQSQISQQKIQKLQPANERLNLIEADENGLYLVGLFDIHHSNPRVPFKCGQIDVDVGESQSRRPMQNMEAFLWAIEQVNSDKSLLPGVRVGSLVLDTCSSFLRTNQQMANLLHGHPTQQAPALPHARQIAAIVADNYDWQSVEAVVSMASALDLTTFVTQSRSSKLSELARKYKPNNQIELNQNLRLGSSSGRRSSDVLEPDDELLQLQRRSGGHPLEGLLGELLGVGKMAAASADLAENSSTLMKTPEENNKLYMVKMPLGNEQLAETLVALVQQMNWDLVSVIYDDEQDMVDLRDELARQLLSRPKTQLAHDELVSTGSSTETYDRLLQNLGRKSTTLGSRVVITLLGTGSARLLLDSLRHLRNQAQLAGPGSEHHQLAQQVNSLLWVTVTDREPYYAFATDALGTIAVSSSVSLLPEFKSYYDRLAMDSHAARNRWWPEYLRAILTKHQRDLELVANECVRWQEPRQSPALERCRSLSLASLIQLADTKRWLLPGASQSFAKAAGGARPPLADTSGKLSKYLAGGWEHNGMDIINSVLAAANGLEAARQTLCPGQRVGLCDRMRELISIPTAAAGSFNQQKPVESESQVPRLPTVSELMYNELLRSTFQLADGRMFNLDDFSSQGGQVEGKFKLYNLRYLQQNSIGFVKFGQYDQLDGLELNTTKARYYPSPTPSFKDQEPIERVRSSCQDESRCLMFDTLGIGSPQQQQFGFGGSSAAANKQTISEEELAGGVNSLFKLDHPLLMTGADSPASQPRQQPPSPGSTSSEQQPQPMQAVSSNQQITTANVIASSFPASRQVIEDSLQVHTMRSAPSLSKSFNWSMVETSQKAAPQQQVNPTTTMRFNTIVLLPLHNNRNNKGYQSPRYPTMPDSACSREPFDVQHSFQHLVALAYAQQVVNGLLRDGTASESDRQADASSRNRLANGNNADSQLVRHQHQQIELTTTVIDYCDQLDLAKSKLAALLASRQQTELTTLAAVGKTVAVIDFDEEISENIGNLASNNNLLHLTIATKRTNHLATEQSSSKAKPSNVHEDAAGDKLIGGSGSAGGRANEAVKPLRVSLLPSKTNEIQAIVKLISAMAQWRLVHLIYTDHHHYRDEFVRRANEANICVSKLIWIPTVAQSKSTTTSHDKMISPFADEHETSSANGSSGKSQTKTTTIEQQMAQLEKTRRLFAQELFDYSQMDLHNLTAPGEHGAQGLNSTRLLVVLASENDATNQLILEAASESMLDDYIWVTTHEWLASVELPAEMAHLEDQEETGVAEPRLPRHFLSTRLETHESHQFRQYLSSLTPALHSPLPTRWFDEFWQQHFHCRLPFAGNPNTGGVDKVCKPGQMLDLTRMAEDDRVHYTIHALESVGEALRHKSTSGGSFSPREFAVNFKHTFESKSGATGRTPLGYGFHIVHRLLPAQRADVAGLGRRENSRDLGRSMPAGQLVRVGLWRQGELVMLKRKTNESVNATSTDASWWLTSNSQLGDSSDLDTTTKVVRSLNRLASIKSRCLAPQTCSLCRQQVERTMAFIKQEEARLGLSASILEPKAISWNYPTSAQQQQYGGQKPVTNTSILDLVPNNVFDGDGDDLDEAGDGSGNQEEEVEGERLEAGKASRQVNIQAASLFDPATGRQLDRQRETDLRRVAGQMSKLQGNGVASFGLQPTSPMSLLNLRQLPGLLMSLLSLLGVVCMVASITYFYPNMLERKSNHLANHYFEGQPQQQRHRHSSIQQANINDYFLLTGLLMLYSINVAFILPATMSVCWFRRIGLATSYTVIFSSILVKVLSCLRQHGSIRRLFWMGGKQSSGAGNQATASGANANANSLQKTTLPVNGQSSSQVMATDPLEESVEVTFESLPHYHDQPAMLNVDDQHQQESYEQQKQTVGSSTIDHQLAVTNTSEYNSPQTAGGDAKPSGLAPSNLLTISICLIISQLLISLVWFIQQPPEPTLYFACWRCSSPTRSPVLFMYEPLISLLYPASLLVITWILAIVAYKNASQDEEQCRTAAKRLLLSGPRLQPRDSQLEAKQRLMDYKLRDTKSLVMTTTLIVLTWSLLTLNMISSNRKLLMLQSSSGSQHSQQPAVYPMNQTESAKQDDLTLVYANIFSGAIIFTFLFIYRLHLFSFSSLGNACSSLFLIGSKSKNRTTFANGNNSSIIGSLLKFNQQTTAADTDGSVARSSNKWHGSNTPDLCPYLPTSNDSSPSLFGTGSHLGALCGANQQRGQERLRLQQFSSYGATHSSSGVGIAADDPMANYHTSTTINPLHSEGFVETIEGGGTKRSLGTSGDVVSGKRHRLNFFNSAESRSNLKEKKRQRASPSLFFGSSNGSTKNKPPAPKPRPNTAKNSSVISGGLSTNNHDNEFKLQRCRSTGSTASSTAKLVNGGGGSDTSSMVDNDIFMDDTISCASSVASSSTSQLQGNDLYPIDCSIQLDTQMPNTANGLLRRSASFNRRSSLRRSANKLSSVKEERVSVACDSVTLNQELQH